MTRYDEVRGYSYGVGTVDETMQEWVPSFVAVERTFWKG